MKKMQKKKIEIKQVAMVAVPAVGGIAAQRVASMLPMYSTQTVPMRAAMSAGIGAAVMFAVSMLAPAPDRRRVATIGVAGALAGGIAMALQPTLEKVALSLAATLKLAPPIAPSARMIASQLKAAPQGMLSSSIDAYPQGMLSSSLDSYAYPQGVLTGTVYNPTL
jgi:hypothetical protein